jgi:DNA-directed RNA polymerase subunit K/omega
MTNNNFEIVAIASLRVRQLLAGCTPRLEGGEGKTTTMARREVLAGKVSRVALPSADEGAEEISLSPHPAT